MTAGGGRRTGRRVLSWVLALVLLVVIGVVVYRDRLADDPPAVTTVTGVIGSEKVPFFADPRVRAVFDANGLDVRVDPAGSRQIATTVQLQNYDFAFPSSSPAADKLLATHPSARTYAPFSSPMAAAAGAKKFTYGMTDPSASNSGFSTVVAVATALVGSGAALTVDQAASTAPALRNFFAAQTLSAGSSGYLQDAYTRRATGADPGPAVDGLVNYESVLLGMNAGGRLPEPLELIYPSDGVVTAEYPFTVLAGASDAARDASRKITDYLRTPDVQRRIMELTHRRPAVPGVSRAAEFGNATLVELPFPGQADVVDTLLTSWFDKIRRPSRTIYVLDTSGSMAEDDRIGQLKRSLAGLSGADASLTGQFRQFRAREEVTLLPFSDRPQEPRTFTVAVNDPGPVRRQISDAGNALRTGGGTAIYDSVERAYVVAAQQIAADPDRFTSIVLMTDGASTAGSDASAFRAFAENRPAALRGVPVFCVLFGDGDSGEMNDIATLTGGTAFDARTAPLPEVFQEIRGYV